MPKSHRGFAAMSPEQQRAIASAGGRAAHQSGHAHEFTSEEARAAGRKGGAARHQSRTARQTAPSLDGQAVRERAASEMTEPDEQRQLAQDRSQMISKEEPRGADRDISEDVWEPVADPRGMNNPESDERSGVESGDGQADEEIHSIRQAEDSQTR